MKETFTNLDKDGNGTLSREELLEGFTDLMGKVEAEKEVNKIMSEVDTDNSGTINYTEFIAASMDKEKAV